MSSILLTIDGIDRVNVSNDDVVPGAHVVVVSTWARNAFVIFANRKER